MFCSWFGKVWTGLRTTQVGTHEMLEMLYVTADEVDVSRILVAFEEWHCRIPPVAPIVELQR